MVKKFKNGDKVRIIKIDDEDFYGDANYKVGCTGIIDSPDDYCSSAYYIRFDNDKYNINPYTDKGLWSAKENWLQEYKPLMEMD